MHNHLYRIFLLVICLLLSQVVTADGTVLFLYDKKNNYHKKYVEQGELLIQQSHPKVTIIHKGIDETWGGKGKGRTLVITVGSAAAGRAAEFGRATLNTLLSRRNFEALSGNYRGPHSAIYMEQPLERQIQLIKNALPSSRRLMVLLGSESSGVGRRLRSQAHKLDMELQLITVTEDKDIDRLFSGHELSSDTLLLLPDHRVVNKHTIKPLVLGSYRKGIPLVGYSQALVKAGALMAVHSPQVALQEQMVRAALNYLRNGVLPAPKHCSEFDVSVNYQLARALRLTLPSESELKKSILRQMQ